MSTVLDGKRLSKAFEKTESRRASISQKIPSTTSRASLQINNIYGNISKDRNNKNPSRKRSLKNVQEISSIGSKSNSEVYDIQSLYQNLNNPSTLEKSLKAHDRNPKALDKSPKVFDKTPKEIRFNENELRRKSILKIKSVKNIYYNALKRRMGRRKSNIVADPDEFTELVKTIQEEIRTPNEIRINDITIIDKTPLERLKRYKDKYPLLKVRKQIVKGVR